MMSKAYMYDLSFCAEDFNICKVREIIAMKQATYAGMKEP